MATLESRLNKIIQDLYPGITEVQVVIMSASIVCDVPHYHGRIPDVCEIIDMQTMKVILEALGVTFPSPPTNGAVLLDGTELDCAFLAGELEGIRPEGAPCTFVDREGSSSLYTRVKNLWVPPDFKGFKTIALVTGIRQGIVNPVQYAPDITGCKILDFIGLPTATGSASLTVTFIPSDINWLTQEGLAGLTWEWDFGEGPVVTTNLPMAQHTYSTPGTYTVTLKGKTQEQGVIVIVKTDYVVVS